MQVHPRLILAFMISPALGVLLPGVVVMLVAFVGYGELGQQAAQNMPRLLVQLVLHSYLGLIFAVPIYVFCRINQVANWWMYLLAGAVIGVLTGASIHAMYFEKFHLSYSSLINIIPGMLAAAAFWGIEVRKNPYYGVYVSKLAVLRYFLALHAGAVIAFILSYLTALIGGGYVAMAMFGITVGTYLNLCMAVPIYMVFRHQRVSNPIYFVLVALIIAVISVLLSHELTTYNRSDRILRDIIFYGAPSIFVSIVFWFIEVYKNSAYQKN